MLVVTESAREVLLRALLAAHRMNPEAHIRIFRRGQAVETGFADKPEENDQVLEIENMSIFVAAEIGDGVIDVSEEHDQIILR